MRKVAEVVDMKTRKLKAGKRHPLLIYKRAMDRALSAAVLLGVLIVVAWGWIYFGEPQRMPDVTPWLIAGGLVAFVFIVFAYLARWMAYVQPRSDHLRVVTPFLNLKVSYRRIRSVHPSDFQQLFPPHEASWSQRNFLEPFFGMTAVVVELTSYPLNRGMLRLFLPRQMFSTGMPGLVFLVPDWMALSTELDSFQGIWLQFQKPRRKVGRGLM
jgi:hypothetical protein